MAEMIPFNCPGNAALGGDGLSSPDRLDRPRPLNLPRTGTPRLTGRLIGVCPCPLHACLELVLASADPGRVVLLCDLHAGVAEEDRDLIDGYAGQQHLDGEGVAEHGGWQRFRVPSAPQMLATLKRRRKAR